MNTTLEIAIFLSLNGRGEEAINFYKKHFNAKILLLAKYSDLAKFNPNIKVTEENKNYIAHSVLQIGKTKLMIAESPMEKEANFKIGNNFSICIQSASLDEINKFYTSLLSDKRVKIITPLGANFFSKAYAVVEDPFGVQLQLMFDPRLK